MNTLSVHGSSDGIQLTTPYQNYSFAGFDYMNTVAYFTEVTDDNSETRILPMTISSKETTGFKRTVTGLTASLNITHVDQQTSQKDFIKKSPPLYSTEIHVSIAEAVTLGNFPDPSGEFHAE